MMLTYGWCATQFRLFLFVLSLSLVPRIISFVEIRGADEIGEECAHSVRSMSVGCRRPSPEKHLKRCGPKMWLSCACVCECFAKMINEKRARAHIEMSVQSDRPSFCSPCAVRWTRARAANSEGAMDVC